MSSREKGAKMAKRVAIACTRVRAKQTKAKKK